jgi:ABC-type branched-subunit amino acid transport system substrate-binding protein
MLDQVHILRKAGPDAIISVGSYAACAAFIRDARNSGWDIPIANVSFVGSENMLHLLMESGKQAGRDYTANLVNSQVVPSYEDMRLPAVREYRDLMQRFSRMPPAGTAQSGYQPLSYSFVSFEGFLNAKLVVELLRKMEDPSDRKRLREIVEATGEMDLGIEAPVTFGSQKHQGLDTVYYTTVENGRFVPIMDWSRWQK